MPNIKKGAETLWDFLTMQGMDADTAKKVVSGELPPELASQRMIEQGYTPDWYHGSTHDVTNYDAKLTNPESDWGQGIYLSNTPEDVAANYATEEGADLTQRIQLLSEQEDISFEEAKQIIAGQTKGITYPSALDESKFAHVGGSTPTWLDELDKTDYEAMARKDLDPKDYDTPEDFEEAVRDEAFNLKLENPESPENEFIEVMREYGVDTSTMPYIDFTDTNTIEDLRNLINGFEFYDANDNIVGSGAVIADWLKQRGFKGILDHNVNKRFGSERKAGKPMEGMDYDTVHAIVFPEHEGVIRSQYGAAFDETKKGQKGILNALAPTATIGLGSGALGMMSPEERLFAAPAQREPEMRAIGGNDTEAQAATRNAAQTLGELLLSGDSPDITSTRGAGETMMKIANNQPIGIMDALEVAGQVDPMQVPALIKALYNYQRQQ